jgi:AcrR family transcriptional regulator
MTERARQPRWTRLEHDERRQQILEAAGKLFAERHYGAVSTTEIADAAGVTRGLLHHYFGTKRDLYLEVLRSMLQLPPQPEISEADRQDPERMVSEAVEAWQELVERNPGGFLAVAGTRGFGKDPEVQQMVRQSEQASARWYVSLFYDGDPRRAPDELWGAVVAWGNLVYSVGVQWLEQKRLTRAQAKVLIAHSLLALVRDVVPEMQQLRGSRRRTSPGP